MELLVTSRNVVSLLIFSKVSGLFVWPQIFWQLYLIEFVALRSFLGYSSCSMQGFWQGLLDWFSSQNQILWNFNNRRLWVILDRKPLRKYPVNAGFPRGSILGPIFFLMCINNFPDYINCIIAIYAEYTTL